MSLAVQIHGVDTHLSIKAAGQYSLANLYDLLDRVKEESEKRGPRGVILDITEVAGTIPISDIYLLGVQCIRVLNPAIRIAIVFPMGGGDKFLEYVAQKSGVPLAVVSNHAAAIKWVNRDQ